MKIEVGMTYVDANNRKVDILTVIKNKGEDLFIGTVTPDAKKHEQYPAIYTEYGERFLEDINFRPLYTYGVLLSHRIVSEYHPAHDWEVDKLIWVRDAIPNIWIERHFAKVEGGRIYAWERGKTSHTSRKTTQWEFATDTHPYEQENK